MYNSVGAGSVAERLGSVGNYELSKREALIYNRRCLRYLYHKRAQLPNQGRCTCYIL